MILTFTCPETGQPFSSSHYGIAENKGVVLDGQGNRTLDAKVVLYAPCPYCGAEHTYRAAELPCPHTSTATRAS